MTKQGETQKAPPKRVHIPADVKARKDGATAQQVRNWVAKLNGHFQGGDRNRQRKHKRGG